MLGHVMPVFKLKTWGNDMVDVRLVLERMAHRSFLDLYVDGKLQCQCDMWRAHQMDGQSRVQAKSICDFWGPKHTLIDRWLMPAPRRILCTRLHLHFTSEAKRWHSSFPLGAMRVTEWQCVATLTVKKGSDWVVICHIGIPCLRNVYHPEKRDMMVICARALTHCDLACCSLYPKVYSCDASWHRMPQSVNYWVRCKQVDDFYGIDVQRLEDHLWLHSGAS